MKCECIPGNYICKRGCELWRHVNECWDAYSSSNKDPELLTKYIDALKKYDEHIEENKK